MEEYDEIRKIGRGALGDVYLCRHRGTNEKVADKRIELSYLNVETSSVVFEEAKLMDTFSKSHHPNVVRFIEHCQSRGLIHLYMEYCSEGSLDSELRQRKQMQDFYEESEVLSSLYQVASGLAFIHEHKVIHRNLKPTNILKTRDGQLKIADFGRGSALALICSAGKMKSETAIYTAPEVIDGNDFSFECDIWSLGVIVYEMVTLRWPFTAKSEYKLFKSIIKTPFAPVDREISNQLHCLLVRMMSKKAAERPSSQCIVGTEFLAAAHREPKPAGPSKSATIASSLSKLATFAGSCSFGAEEQDSSNMNLHITESTIDLMFKSFHKLPQPDDYDPELLYELGEFIEKYEESRFKSEEWRWTLLHYLCFKGKAELVEVLLEMEADTEVRDEDGKTPLHWASMQGNAEVTKVLLDYDAYVEAKDYDGWTSLHWASHYDRFDVVKLLLQHGRADVNSKNKKGKTPLSTAVSNSIRSLLKEHGATSRKCPIISLCGAP